MAYKKMRRRRHAVRRSHTRRRRVGSAGSTSIMTLAVGVGAAIGAKFLMDKISTTATTLSPKILGGAAIVAGFLAPRFVKGAMGQAVGLGVAAAGGLVLGQSLGIISGSDLLLPVGGVPDVQMLNTGRTQQMPANNSYLVGCLDSMAA